jgi:hypothetical protein
MRRLLFWTLVAALFGDIALLVALSHSPESVEKGWRPLLTTPNYGFAGFVAMLIGAVIQPRGLVWIIALGMCILGSVIWLLTAIDLPNEGIRWANAATLAVAASLVLGLRWASLGGRVDPQNPDLPGSASEPSGRDT